MRRLVLFVACIFATIGVVGIASPAHLVAAMRIVITPAGLYAIGALRLGVGLVLIGAAASSHLPKALRAIGVVLVVAGLATPLLGVDRTRAMLDYGSTHGELLIRAAGTVLLAFGAFIAWAATPPRQH